MALLDIIKQAGAAAHASGNPMAVMAGKVLSINPLQVNVDQRFTLTEDFLIVPESLTRFEVDLTHSHSIGSGQTGEALQEKLLIRRGLEAGDAVLLLRVQGGQKFVILDKVVA
ncbi:DUF2577 domain-containing protein [Paenibacillus radicis (ex Gao et al. 2016)]|uniref:DUF2577 domain-containing protein n=1 Tax=Paenibacillus radicis (ex Gao et al. 2016) TaxID=1737354 RepID=A0A917M6W7_9BACL|nr:DUF2577 domain-containing protein [Paenibacillus radicis (ex Gao et al. 2016)]GGG81769.1 hypothetical protein GCM10010918_43810 [Paenibacillus radicis (ex Gao et al. 2016)]